MNAIHTDELGETAMVQRHIAAARNALAELGEPAEDEHGDTASSHIRNVLTTMNGFAEMGKPLSPAQIRSIAARLEKALVLIESHSESE